MAHDGGLQSEVQAFDKAIGCGLVGSRPAELDATHLGQVVEDLDSNWRPY